MPLLEIELVGEPDAARRPGLAARLAGVAGAALGARPGGTWARLRVLPVEDYGESGAGDDPGVRPVFVSLIERGLPEGEDLQERVRALADAVAEACGRPAENVHVIVEPPGRGRVAFGGTLVE